MIKTIALCASLMVMFLAPFTVRGEEPSSVPPADLVQMRKLLEEQMKQLEAQKQELQSLRRRLDALQPRSAETARPPSVPVEAARPVAPVEEKITVSPAEKGPLPAQPVGQAPERPRPPDIALASEQRGVLTPRGRLILEPSLQYTNSSVNRVALEGYTIIPALTIGKIEIQKVNRDTYTGAIAARYGITHRFEVEAKIPYVHRSDTTQARPLEKPTEEDIVKSVRGEGIGDAEFALRYQMNQGQGGWPYLIGNMRVKSHTGKSPFDVATDNNGLQTELPTGSGFWGVQPSLTMVLPSDPAVLFGNVSYLWNIKRDLGGNFKRIDPGDAIGINFGMGLALNEKASYSIAYDLSVIGKSKQNGETIPRSQTIKLGSLLLGYAYRLTPDSSINVSIGVGITADAPDMQLTLRMPTGFFAKPKG